MKLFEEFQPVSKEEWLQKVTSDLKGKKSIEELSTAKVGCQVVSPFYHSDDLTEQIDIPSTGYSSTILGVELTINNDEIGNKLILESLEGGASFLKLKIKNASPDFKILFIGVMLDLITVVAELDGERASQSCKEYIQSHYDDTLSNFIFNAAGAHFIKTEKSVGASFQSLLSDGSKVILSEGDSSTFFQLPIGHNYIENICAIQATRLLWANLLEAHGYDHNSRALNIICFVPSEVLSSVQYDNMISLTQMAMSAMSGGADIIMLPPSDVMSNPEGKENTRRISRNIYNLMTMEAHMHRVQSPTDGSYLFDKVSANLARRNWNQFIKNQEV